MKREAAVARRGSWAAESGTCGICGWTGGGPGGLRRRSSSFCVAYSSGVPHRRGRVGTERRRGRILTTEAGTDGEGPSLVLLMMRPSLRTPRWRRCWCAPLGRVQEAEDDQESHFCPSRGTRNVGFNISSTTQSIGPAICGSLDALRGKLMLSGAIHGTFFSWRPRPHQSVGSR